jgi:hypothetical protein
MTLPIQAPLLKRDGFSPEMMEKKSLPRATIFASSSGFRIETLLVLGDTNSKSWRYLRWLVFGSSKYYLYVFVASILAALISSLI